MPLLSRFAGQLINVPWLIDAGYADVALASIADRIGVDAPLIDAGASAGYTRPSREVVIDQHRGIAIIPVVGALIHRGNAMNPQSGASSYTAFQSVLKETAAMRGVRGIVLDIDSPGGEVAGIVETSDFLAKLAGEVPIYAVANSLMASAAFWLGSVATRLYASPLSTIGSVGVVVAHQDHSVAEARRGVVTTHIFAGAKKVDGHGPLTDAVRASVQGRIDTIYEKFVSHIATHRNMDVEAVRATEAAVFSPDMAVKTGFADGIATLPEIIDALHSRVSPQYFGGSAFPSATSQLEPENMTERTAFAQGDIDMAVSRAMSDASASNAAVLATARTALVGELAAAAAGLDPENARMSAFFEAVAEGASVTLAAKMAGRIPAPVAAVVVNAPAAAAQRDAEHLFANSAPNVPGGDIHTADPRAARMAELAAAAKHASAMPRNLIAS